MSQYPLLGLERSRIREVRGRFVIFSSAIAMSPVCQAGGSRVFLRNILSPSQAMHASFPDGEDEISLKHQGADSDEGRSAPLSNSTCF